jgi:hypothetical protein
VPLFLAGAVVEWFGGFLLLLVAAQGTVSIDDAIAVVVLVPSVVPVVTIVGTVAAAVAPRWGLKLLVGGPIAATSLWAFVVAFPAVWVFVQGEIELASMAFGAFSILYAALSVAAVIGIVRGRLWGSVLGTACAAMMALTIIGAITAVIVLWAIWILKPRGLPIEGAS